MELKEIMHRWPPNIQAYEQKFFGVPMTKFIVSAVGGMAGLVVVSQRWPGFGGIIGGAIFGLIVFGLIILLTTKFPNFYNLTIPGYWWNRTFQPAHEKTISLPLIISSGQNQKVVVEDWEGQTTGEIE